MGARQTTWGPHPPSQSRPFSPALSVPFHRARELPLHSTPCLPWRHFHFYPPLRAPHGQRWDTSSSCALRGKPATCFAHPGNPATAAGYPLHSRLRILSCGPTPRDRHVIRGYYSYIKADSCPWTVRDLIIVLTDAIRFFPYMIFSINFT